MPAVPRRWARPVTRVRRRASDGAKYHAFVKAGVSLVVLFAVVFYGADHIAARQTARFTLYFAWERAIPFHVAAFVPYYSVFLLPFVVPFGARDTAAVRIWGWRMAACITAAGAVFVVLPADLGYPPPPITPLLHEATLLVAGRHNLVPSLHVALTLVCVSTAAPGLASKWRLYLYAWAVLLVASTLVTHQHHVLDVVTGAILAIGVRRLVNLAREPEEAS